MFTSLKFLYIFIFLTFLQYLSNHFLFYRSPMNYLLLNLAIADIMYAAFIAPRVYFQLTFNHPDGVIGTVFCKFVTDGSVAWIGGASSIVTLTAIAIERYYAVMYPHGNKWKLTEQKLKVSPNDKYNYWYPRLFFVDEDLRRLSSRSLRHGGLLVGRLSPCRVDWVPLPTKVYKRVRAILMLGSNPAMD